MRVVVRENVAWMSLIVVGPAHESACHVESKSSGD